VTNEEQLGWERRVGPLAGIAAWLAAILVVAQFAVTQVVVFADRPDTDRGFLIAIHDNASALLVSGILQAIGALALGVVFWYLFKATRHRRKELPGWLIGLVYAGPLLFAAAGVLGVLDRIDIADQFVSDRPTTGRAGEERADDLLKSPSGVTVALGFAGTLSIAILYVLISMNAMRAGLLSRFTGVMGIIVGALVVLPLVPGGSLVLQIFWLGAVGALFMGRWPGGRGPAWDSGRAEPWPTAAQRRELATAGEPNEPGTAPDPEPLPQRPSSRKRKRKKRR
jgi:hypothetical protein